MRIQSPRRAAFTLVELVVAISLAIVITAVSVAVLNSGAADSQRVISAADRVSGWLITAKNRAKRDNRPRGVRFYRSQTDPNMLSEAQYIEQPELFVPNPTKNPSRGRIVFVYEQDTNSSSTTYQQITKRFVYYVSDDTGDLTLFDQQVQVGDLMYLPLFGATYKLLAPSSLPPNATSATPFPRATVRIGTNPPTSQNARLLTLASYPDLGTAFSPSPLPSGSTPPPQACLTTFEVAFQPAVRPLFGEPVLQLSPDAVIDARGTTSFSVPATGDFDVLFSPSGEARYGTVGQTLGQNNGLLAFWIRDPNKTTNDPITDFDNAGEQVLAVVYTKTGAVATHPVVSADDPYRAAKDGINAGF